jgi:thioredoxin reductase (NADPH)
MLTADELAALPIFSTLSPVALADVARAAADIRLNAGEYAVYEGEPPALLVVIEGAIEVIKLVDGIERKIGMRLPGKLFGEVPLVFGTQFQAAFRAGEPTRIVKLDARPYYDLAASSPELVRAMDALARERIGGLQKLAAEPRNAQVILLGNRWDSACLDLRRFLERNPDLHVGPPVVVGRNNQSRSPLCGRQVGERKIRQDDRPKGDWAHERKRSTKSASV